ncbi:ribokinase [Algihabitans albus]|uniref:ribokinase n=1 Tax=Algihabitans albus TaxID=2164067 RepID=UPI001F3A04DA|nr:ribokinase [Algihabitans albus]
MIVVVGSINMDLVVRVPRFPEPGETLLGGDLAQYSGGKGANQAVAAARAGGSVSMVGRVGNDAFGPVLRDRLASERIEVDPVTAVPGPSGVAVITVDRNARNTIVVSPGANHRLTPDDLDRTVFEGASAVLLQLETPLETVMAAARMGRAAGARTALNLAPAQSLEPRHLADIDLLLVNESEAALLTGVTAEAVADDPEIAVENLAARVPAVVLTLGAAGACWAERRALGRVPGFAVEAVDTTGAGDSFTGALSVALGEGLALPDAVRFGNAAGALAATRIGAQPAIPKRAEIDAFLAGRSA